MMHLLMRKTALLFLSFFLMVACTSNEQAAPLPEASPELEKEVDMPAAPAETANNVQESAKEGAETDLPATPPPVENPRIDPGTVERETAPEDNNEAETPETEKVEPVDIDLGEGQEVNLQPAPPEPEPFTRPRRRMNVEQLNAALLKATGGFTWMDGNKVRFESLAATLGRPDYLSRVVEDLEPGPVFAKFIKDAAYSVCAELIAHEQEVSTDERVLMVHVMPEDTIESHPEEVDANLRMLLLRFHGHYPDADAPELEPWRWLFQSATHLSDSPTNGWRAVCVALIAHPNFYSY